VAVTDPDTPAPSRAGRLLLLVVACCELVLAGLARATASGGWCPVEGSVFGCVAVSRPRVSQLGPLAVGDLGVLGASLAVGVAAVFLARGVRLPWARDGAIALACCAGFALGVQPLAWLAGGALCPTCFALALVACAVAGVAVYVARREARVDLRLPLVAGVCALVLTGGWAVWRGGVLQEQDRVRTQAALAAGGETGPRIVLVALDGCPYCEATLADVLGDPDVIELLESTRGLERVGPDDARAAGVKGAPTLLAFDADGAPLAEPLQGYPSLQEGYDWLQGAIAAAGGG
jgi:hypothetical protein